MNGEMGNGEEYDDDFERQRRGNGGNGEEEADVAREKMR